MALGALTGAVLVVQPIAMQRTARPARQVVTINGRQAIAGEALVKYRRSLASHEWRQLAQLTDADEDAAIGGAGARRIHSRRYSTSALLDFLRADPEVAYAEPNYIIEADAIPNDTYFGQLWGLLNVGQVVGVAGTPGADIGASLAWDVSTGSRANVVAVVDTGIDYTHSDLAPNVWSAPAPFSVTIGGQTMTCAAGTHGFNAITRSCDPYDDNGHGSHVAGTIGAVGNNNSGVVGVNWTASIIASKFLDATGVGTIADAINAIEFVIQASAATGTKVRVISNSWSGGGFSQALLDAINSANTNDMLFVASAGNNGQDNDLTPRYPASYNAPNVMAVASTNNTDTLAGTSNYGATSVHLAAPGVNILSTIPVEGYQYFSGTSMAVPHVSGAAVLVLSRCALNTGALRSNLLASVDLIPALTGRVATGGRLNVNTAIRACPAFVNDPPAAVADAATTSEDAAVTIAVLANDTDPDGDSLSVTGVGAPLHGIAAVNGNGTITYTPAANYNGGDTFTYTISDGRDATATGSVAVTITAVNDAPVAIAQSVVTDEDSAKAITLSATDVEGSPLTYAIVAAPSHGTLGGMAPAVIYTPAANYNGPDSFAFKANDGSLDSSVVTVSITVTAVDDPPPIALAVDKALSVDGAGTVSTEPFSTAGPGELLVAFVGSDGPTSGDQRVTVSGANLPWTPVSRANTQLGTAEIWQALAVASISNAAVSSTQTFGGYHQSMTVVAFTGAGGTGAAAASGDPTGAPSVSLIPTRDGSLVYGVGNDWDSAIAHVVGPNQTMIHEWVDAGVGDTFWVQAHAASATSGTTVTLNNTSPTTDQWNFAAVEIVPAAPAALNISNVLAANPTASSITITWQTNLPSTSRVEYGLDSNYGLSISDPTLVTNHAIALIGLSPSTTYHYRVASQTSSGLIAAAGDFIFTTAAVSVISCNVTAPTGGANVSGQATVSAHAVSTAGVAGVQFQLDGSNLGAEILNPPADLSITWDTTSGSNGSHTLSCVARDPTSNQATSGPVVVTVSNATVPSVVNLTLDAATTAIIAAGLRVGTVTTAPSQTVPAGSVISQNPAGGTRVAPDTTVALVIASVPQTPDGLVAAYGFNEGSGAQVADGSGQGNTGTISNATWAATGKAGAALSFNGIDAWASVPDAPSLDLTTGLTIEAWVRPTSGSGWRTVALKEDVGGLAYALYSDNGASRPAGYVHTNVDVGLDGTAAVPLDTWTHLAVTYDGATLRMFVNGVEVSSSALTGTITDTSSTLRIGGNSVWNEYYHGLIDEVRIYSRALTAAEIQTDMITPIP